MISSSERILKIGYDLTVIADNTQDISLGHSIDYREAFELKMLKLILRNLNNLRNFCNICVYTYVQLIA